MGRLFSLLFLVLAFCCTGVSGESTKLKVGVILPLSGPLADYGNAIKNGIELYRSQYPTKVKHLNFVYEDDHYDSKTSISAYHKLSTIDKVDIFFAFGAPAASALAPILERDGKILINISADEAPTVDRKLVIRTMNYSAQYMRGLLEYLRKRDVKEFSVVDVENSYLRSMKKGLERNLIEGESLVEVGSVNPSDLDFRNLILKSKLKNIKALGLFLMPEQMVIFMKQAKENRFSPNIFSTNMTESAILLPNSEGLEGSIYPYHSLKESFVLIYKERYMQDSQLPFGGSAYDMVSILANGIKSEMKRDNETLMSIFQNVKEQEGVLGNFSYVQDQEGGKYFKYPIVVKQVINGIAVVIE